MKTRKKRPLLITGFLIGTGILLMAYPFVSNSLYEHRQEEVIYEYQKETDKMDTTQIHQMLKEAEEYNVKLKNREAVLTDPFDPELAVDGTEEKQYEHLMNPENDGIMGYIEIPEINVFLPVYHGTSQEVLRKGVGHLENTSLPVGGKDTHCVLSAHTGLSDKKLFTDLVLLKKGDLFYIQVLDRRLAYEVDQIRVVRPEDTSLLRIIPEKDLVTLVTCTPYGVNSHRLLVRGHRVTEQKNPQKAARKKQTASPWMHQYVISILIGMAFLMVFLTGLFLYRRRKM